MSRSGSRRARPGASARGGIADLACACATVRRASRALTVLYDQCLAGHGIEAPQFALLAMIERAGPCSQTAIGRHFVLDKTTLSRNLKRLEQRGWITAVAGADARERRVALTSAGRRLVAAAKPAWRRAQDQLRASMRREHWEALWDLLDAVTHAAGAARQRHDANAQSAR